MASISPTFLFPKENEILNYLNKHPVVSNLTYFKDKKILNKIAQFFADKIFTEADIYLKTITCLCEDSKLNFTITSISPFQPIFVSALKNCAQLKIQ